jgi:hypothetical protein
MRMHIRLVCAAIALFFCSMPLCAQQELTGIYKGRFGVVHRAGLDPWPLDATLEIVTAENGELAGKFRIWGSWIYVCNGNYSIQGVYHANRLDMRTSAGNVRGCGMDPLVLTVQGNKLLGTFGGAEIELQKIQSGASPAPVSR